MTVIIKAECSYEAGSGHLMRTLSFSEEISRRLGSDIVFALNNAPAHFAKLVESRGFRCEALEAATIADEKCRLATLIQRAKPKMVVTDSYFVDSGYLRTIKEACPESMLLAISDFADTDYSAADIVVNHNIYGAELARKYSLGPEATLLGGEKYAILRDEFANRSERRITEAPPKALVTFGGSDPQDLTLKAAQALSRSGIESTIVVGAMHKGYGGIKKLESPALKVLQNVPGMCDLMQDADFALASAGTTTYELLATELPSAFYKIADNQRLIVETVKKRGLGIYAGEGESVTAADMEETIAKLADAKARRSIHSKIKGLVDGMGKKRIMDEVMKRM